MFQHGLDGGSWQRSSILEQILHHPKHSGILENRKLLLRLSCDGAKITKLRDSVRATFKIVSQDRERLTEEAVKPSPDDELTLLFYMGKFPVCLRKSTGMVFSNMYML
mgnify:CR=1 FL=1